MVGEIVERFRTSVVSRLNNDDSPYLKKSKDCCIVCGGKFDGTEWYIERAGGNVIGAFCSGKCSAKYREIEDGGNVK